MMKRRHIVLGATLLALLGLGLLSGCGSKESQATPGTEAERQQKNADAISKEGGAGAGNAAEPSHGNISSETGGAPKTGN